MRCASVALAVLCAAPLARAAGINTDSAISAGRGQVVARTQLRAVALDNEVERFLLRETIVVGVTNRLGLIATIGHVWQGGGAPDGFTDLPLRARYELVGVDRKRATLTVSAIAGYELPVGEEPIGSPDGGWIAGVVGTWEREGWRVDADLVAVLRPDAPDARRADLAVSRILVPGRRSIVYGVLELNYERAGSADVLFLSPGVQWEIPGWRFELSILVPVAEDAAGPTPEVAVAVGFLVLF